MHKTLKLGTRRSLLAMAQSSWVAREIERLNPGLKIELVGIETQGDRIVDIPLRDAQGKEFFAAELDHALVNRQVDFCVHSMKDLSLDRPKGTRLACVPPRETPHDIVVFRADVTEKLKKGETLVIGTSSPRRLENIPKFLKRALPRLGPEPKLKFVDIRGNVNTRLSRIHEYPGHERALDAVVLALAGFHRLWGDESARVEFSRLLEKTRFMILPLSANPSAPAQGALSVECRDDDEETFAILRKLHHQPSEDEARAERAVLREWGGGCHQMLGATARHSAHMGLMTWVKGLHPRGWDVDEVRWSAPKPIAGSVNQALSSGEWRAFEEQYLDLGAQLERDLQDRHRVWCLSHSRALPEKLKKHVGERHLVTGGTASWFRLANEGLWVEACSDSLGASALAVLLGRDLVRHLQNARHEPLYFTHEGARVDQPFIKVASYRLVAKDVPSDVKTRIHNARFFYWTSESQYDGLRPFLDETATLHHACGAGKTARALEERGLNVHVFPSEEEWRNWLA